MRSGGKTIVVVVGRKHYGHLYMIKHVNELLDVISIIIALAIRNFLQTEFETQIHASRYILASDGDDDSLGVFII